MQDVNTPPATPGPAVLPHVHVHVRVGGCDIAIPIEQVRQALALPPQGLTVLPRRSGALLGVADVNGVTVPIVALERWLPLPTVGESVAVPRLLVLHCAGALVGVRVDAVLGVKAVAAQNIRRVHHAPDDNEWFESVVPASAGTPTLCILEVARLMRLAQAWAAAAELEPAVALNTVAPAAQQPGCATQRFALFRIGQERWAVPVAAVQQVVPLPATELALGPNERAWAIGQWQGRKLPLVDISEGRQASDRQSAPWMALLCQGPLVLGLAVSECEQLLDLAPGAVACTPDDPLLAGVALWPGLGKLQVLDVDKLFGLTPGASISRMAPAAPDASRGTGASDATEPVPYLVFDADQRYASPVEGIVGVVELSPQAQDDLRQSRRAVLAWRGQTIRVVSLPAIARSAPPPDPLLAVLVQAPGDSAAPIGIAIRSLCDWLPAHSARRSGMRMGAMGEFGLINAKGALNHANLVVVDLAQMAYMLG